MFSISIAAQRIGVCTKTLRRYESKGFITPYRTPGGHRRYSIRMISDVLSISMNHDNPSVNPMDTIKYTAVYARVSSHEQKQKGDLQRQVETLTAYCTSHSLHSIKIYKDVGSGLNTARLGLRKMFHDIKNGTISQIVIAYKDRLTRFGYEFIEDYCGIFGVPIIVTQSRPNQSVLEGLSEDIISLMASFSGKLYGMRSAEKKKNKLLSNVKSIPTEQQLEAA